MMQKKYLSIASEPLKQGVLSKAWDGYQKQGMPTSKSELWRYTPLAKLQAHSFTVASLFDVDVSYYEARFPHAYVLLCYHGGWLISPACREALQQEGVSCDIIKEEDLTKSADVTHYLENQLDQEGDMRGLGVSYLSCALMLSVLADTVLSRPIYIVYQGEKEALDSSYIKLVMGERSYADVYEIHENHETTQNLSLTMLDFEVKKEAKLKHYRLYSGKEGWNIDTLHAHVLEKASYDVYQFSFDQRNREQINRIALKEEEASSNSSHVVFKKDDEYTGCYHGVWHKAPRTTSSNMFRGMLDDKAHAAFRGFLEIARDAQHVSGSQGNHTLLLSDQAVISGKPELKIYADDVKCSHGMTVGALDENQIFYLMSRGISRSDAEKMILKGFVGDLLEHVKDNVFKDMCLRAFESQLQGRK